MDTRPAMGAVSTAPALNLASLPAEIRANIGAQTTPDFAPVTVTNAMFLAAIAPNLDNDERLWSAHFNTKPGGFPPLASVWGGYPLKAAEGVAETPSRNAYFSVATIRPDKNGEHHRRRECFSRLFCVVLDDAAPPAGLAPTWVLATSAGKTQVGFKLTAPLADSGIATRLHKALAAAGHLAADKNGNNPVRYVRLPVGSNTKYDPVFAHQLLHWAPDNTVTLDALISGLGLDRAAILTPPVEPEKMPLNSVISNAEEWVIKAKRIGLDAALRTVKDPSLGRHQEIFALGCRAARDGLPPEALDVALDAFAANMRPTDTNGVESGINWDSERKAIRDGYRQGCADGVPKLVDASGLVVQAPAKAAQPAAAAALDGDESPLTRLEAESLIAWAWSTGTTLPRKPAGLFAYRTLKNLKGEPKTREAMRSPIVGFNTYTAPWIELGWHTTKADFMGEVAKYLPNRANIVMAQAEKNGTVPNDVSSDVLIADAQSWLNRVGSLVVADAIGRELLARVLTEWPEPQPIPATLCPVEMFDMALLPASLRDWIADVSERMQCPPDFPAVGAMVALSSVIGRKAVIRPKRHDDWAVVPNLWGAVVGRPGIMKSPALSAALAPLDRLQAKANSEHKDAKRDYARNEKLRAMQDKSDEAKAQKLIAQGKRSEAEQLLIEAENDADNSDAPPVLRRYRVTDASVEALGEILIENQWGTLAYRDELHGLLASMDKEGQEGARSFYLQGYDGNQSYTFDRIVRGRHLHIPAVCLALLGGIQPGKLKSYVRAATEGGNGDDGLLQRFSLIVWPDVAQEWRDVDRWPETEAKNRAFAVFERLDTIAPTIDPDTGESAPAVYRFSPAAQGIFKQWRAELEQRLRDGSLPPALESHLSKYRKLVPAIALVCALADSETEVSEASLLRALAWGEYLESHAKRVYAAGMGLDLDGAVALLAKIKAGSVKDGFKPSDVYLKGWAGLATPKDVGGAARILCDLGYLRRDETPPQAKGGRPSVTYSINPLLSTE
ncbi:Protein of unknown function [Allochromatium warmingii]|uniref:DUF3987 domain-containing protein n=1 Tax=Allochromatium warmingii TaxID=61595 RepID=A0A1H3JUT7_ALLWA|nr:YfjI family protein [Allochromatium warmingii]SDY43098.1 Protein of unknown function [Allochromatium warmingii]